MEAPVKPGDVLAGKFRVERVLGVGGMGVVVAATHLQLDQLVALKFMLHQVAKNEEFVGRFLREAKAAAKLKNQNCAKVLDVGTLDGGEPYIVLEYLEGCDLQEVIEKRGVVSTEEAVDYVMQACVGMAEAHQKGIVHRDLKPQNLFLATGADGQPIVKILDFGIAKASFDMGGAAQTQSQAVMGSPYYMSPEQMRSAKQADARSDIWALGAILYHLLSGTLPFRGESLPVLCVEIMTNPPAPFDTHKLQVPEPLKRIVLQCLDKDPDARPQSATQLVRLLAPFSPTFGAQRLAKASALAREETQPGDPISGGYAAATPPSGGAPAHRLARTQMADSGPVLLADKPHAAALGTTLGRSAGELPSEVQAAPTGSSAGRFLLPLIGVLAVAGGAGAVVLLSSSGGDAKNAAAPEQSTLVPSRASDAAVARKQTFMIITEPAGALVTIDGVALGPSPLRFKAIAGTDVALRLTLEGHKPVDEMLSIDGTRMTYRVPLLAMAAAPVEKGRRRDRERKPLVKPVVAKPPVVVKPPTVVKPPVVVQPPVVKPKPRVPRDRLERRLKNIKALLKDGLISKKEYNQRKRVILDEEL